MSNLYGVSLKEAERIAEKFDYDMEVVRSSKPFARVHLKEPRKSSPYPSSIYSKIVKYESAVKTLKNRLNKNGL